MNLGKYLIGAGQALFNRFDANGQATTYRDLGNAKSFTLTIATEKLEHTSNKTKAKTTDFSAITKFTATGKITLEEFDPANLALAVLGENSILNQAAVANGSQDITVTELDRYYRVPAFGLTTITVKSTDATKTYASGTDYVANLAHGVIFIPANSTIGKGTAVKVTYTAPELVLNKIVPALSGGITGMFMFLGDSNGPCYNLYAKSITVTPSGDIGLISDDFASFDLEIDFQSINGQAPFEIVQVG